MHYRIIVIVEFVGQECLPFWYVFQLKDAIHDIGASVELMLLGNVSKVYHVTDYECKETTTGENASVTDGLPYAHF